MDRLSKPNYKCELITPKGGYWGEVYMNDQVFVFETSIEPKPDRREYIIGCVDEMLIKNVQKKK